MQIKVQLWIEQDEWAEFGRAVAAVSADSDPKLTRSSELRKMIRDYNTRVLPAEQSA